MPFVAEGLGRAARIAASLAALNRTLGALPNLERETGIEPATNSLEGCDSTTELLPQNPLLATS